MGSRRASGAARMEGTLLALSRDAERLSRLLTLTLPPSARKRAAQTSGLPPYVGAAGLKRLAADLGRHARLRASVADALCVALPEAAPQDTAPPGADAPREAVLAAVRTALEADGSEGAERATALLDSHGEELKPARDRSRPAAAGKPRKAPVAATPPAPRRSDADALKETKAQLATVRREKAELEKKIHAEKRRADRLQAQLDKAEAKRSAADERAAKAKKDLAGARSASQREQDLDKRAREAERARDVARKKRAMVEEVRDGLLEQLEDLQRFAEMEEEDVPSFRDKPLLAAERELGEALAAHDWKPRILVVGGGEPQRPHLAKFAEYAEAVGFAGEWRLADYVSWHKAIDKLGEDMKRRFDAMVILHWNRTTFTRKAREACNNAGQKPCVTCHYEGFTSLRQSLQETLRQLLAARDAAS